MYREPKQWIMVRIDRVTHAKLAACKRRFESEANAGKPIGEVRVDRFGLSIDSVVNELIRRDEAHRERSRESGKRRRAKGKASKSEPSAE